MRVTSRQYEDLTGGKRRLPKIAFDYIEAESRTSGP